MKKIIIPMLILLMVVLVFSSCSEPTTPTTTSPTTSSPTTAPPTTTSPTTSTVPTTSAPPTTTPTSEIKTGGIIRVAYKGFPPNFGDPTKGNLNNGSIYMCLFEGLLTVDKEGVAPKLATGWEFSPDYSSLTMTLRAGVKFHDGAVFDAEAAKYNLDLARGPGSANPALGNVSSVDIIDDYTIRINFSEYRSYFLEELANSNIFMFSPTAIENHDSEWLLLNPITTGPFKLKSFTPDVTMELEKFDDYWEEGKPYLDGVVCDAIADTTVLRMDFQAGNYDCTIGLDPRDVEGVLAEIDGGANSIALMADVLNPDSINPASPFYEKKVRQAVAYAIHYDEIPNIVGYGTQITNQIAMPGSWAYNPNVQGYYYDLDKAKELLAQTNFAGGFETTLMWPDISQPDVATAIQGWLSEIGIIVDLQFLSYPALLPIAWGEYSNALVWNYSHLDPARHGIIPLLNTQNPGAAQTSKSVAFTDEYAQLMEAALNETDRDEQQKLIWRMQEILIDEECLTIPTFCLGGNFVYHSYVHADWWEYCLNAWHPADMWIDK